MPSTSPPATSIGPLAESDREEAVHLLALAFRDNPLNRAVIASADPVVRTRCNLSGMRALMPVALRHGSVLAARVDERLAGVLIGAPPGGYPLPAPALGARLRCLWGQGWRVAQRWGGVFQTLDALHPLEPAAYLGTLGVDPARQRRGVGSALLARWLADLDRDGLPAYLETDAAGGVRFYRGAGFRVVGEAEVLGTRIWRMTRAPGGG